MPLYERLYPRAYAPRWYQDRLEQQVARLTVLYRLGEGEHRGPPPVEKPRQLALV